MRKPASAVGHDNLPRAEHQAWLIQNFVQAQANASTRRAYLADLCDFWGGMSTDAEVDTFIALEPSVQIQRLARYEEHLRARGLRDSTIKRRLTTLRKFISWNKGEVHFHSSVASKPEASKRSPHPASDVSILLLSTEKQEQLLGLPDTSNVQGVRDSTILYLMIESALSRAEICALNHEDFDAQAKVLMVPVKGHSTNRTAVPLQERTFLALRELTGNLSRHLPNIGPTPLFYSIKKGHKTSGERLTIDGIYHLVRSYGTELGEPNLSSRQLQQSAIVRVLEEVKGDVLQAKNILPHISLPTLQRYKSELTLANS